MVPTSPVRVIHPVYIADSPADIFNILPQEPEHFSPAGRPSGILCRADLSITKDNISPFDGLSSHFTFILMKKGDFYFNDLIRVILRIHFADIFQLLSCDSKTDESAVKC